MIRLLYPPGLRLGQYFSRCHNAPQSKILTVKRYDGLAYCTWNALGRELSEDRILSALQDLSDNGIYGSHLLRDFPKICANHAVAVSTLIIDDNWQSLVMIARRSYQQNKTDTSFVRILG